MSTQRWPGTPRGDRRLHAPRFAALCDLGLVAGPLCALLSDCFTWVPACCCAGDAAEKGTPGRGRGRRWDGGPGGDKINASPGQGGGQGGAGQVAPAAPESAECAPHLQVCGWRCAGRKVWKWRDREEPRHPR